MGGKLDVRLSDADRHACGNRLRDAYADGRITLDELHHRLDLAYRAMTRGDLVPVTADLPKQRAARRRDTRWYRVPWFYVEVNVVLWGLWGAQELFSGGATHDLWPLWISVPWAGLIVVQRARPHRRPAAD